jgi:hypothetical protein
VHSPSTIKRAKIHPLIDRVFNPTLKGEGRYELTPKRAK